ncbi:MAG: class I SAM-dependent methyltransferase [Desulfobacteraceae bacterium]|nr:class I SAM-dependent methyltransferase [Desulfobacteraceae bacterium]
MKMNSFIGKQILSIIRERNYAHAGEEEAIELVFQDIPRDPERKMLDVGCGRGGTAHYLHKNGWGQVSGIDIEPTSIEYAKTHFPEIDFTSCDIANIANHIDKQFDLIYFFNSFYAFNDQPGALKALGQVAKQSTKMLLFDYCDLGGYAAKPIIQDGVPFLPQPIKKDTIEQIMNQAGWDISKTTDLTPEYERWYSELMDKIKLKKEEILQAGGKNAWNSVSTFYSALLKSIKERRIGGIIIEADFYTELQL